MLIGCGVGVALGAMVGVCVGCGVAVSVGVYVLVLVWLDAAGVAVDVFWVCGRREQLISRVVMTKMKNSFRIRFWFIWFIVRINSRIGQLFVAAL
jgi:uncharacterized membrane protein (Fun14 family)